MNYSILAQVAFLLIGATFAVAGTPFHPEYHVLPPVTKGNLSIFPVVGGPEYDTAQLLTLDEGLRSGLVVVTEAGPLQGLVRSGTRIPQQSGAEVNRLVLINNSDHPLLLLAGEVVTGASRTASSVSTALFRRSPGLSICRYSASSRDAGWLRRTISAH